MSRVAWQDRVSIDPSIHHGEPCIKGTRVSVAVVVGSLADGMSAQEIVAEYPQLVADDVFAALAYAAEVVEQDFVMPLSA